MLYYTIVVGFYRFLKDLFGDFMIRGRTWLLLFFSILTSVSLIHSEESSKGLDFGEIFSMYGATQFNGLSLQESAAVGFKQGVAKATANATAQAISTVIVSPLKKVQALVLSSWFALLKNLHGLVGFTVAELIGFKWMLERSIKTHISEKAKGARVIRAHIAESNNTATKNNSVEVNLFGIQALKQDLKHLEQKLTEQLNYYTQTVQSGRTRYDILFDCLAGATGVGALSLNHYFPQPAYYEKQARLDSMYLNELRAQARRSPLVPTFEDNFVNRIKDNTKKYQDACKEQNSLFNWSLSIGKYATIGLVLWRLYALMKAKNTPARVDTLAGIDRPMVAHLTKTALDHVQNLLQLCDKIHETGDIALYKDDFELISKNCGDTLIHIAFVINQEEAIRLQRTKPGQAGSSLAPAPTGYTGMPAY